MIDDELMTVEEAASYLRVPASWVYAHTRSGTIPVRRIGPRLLRVPRRSLLAWVDAQDQTAQQEAPMRSRGPSKLRLPDNEKAR
jgi:excisionase family DNA binding protein